MRQRAPALSALSSRAQSAPGSKARNLSGTLRAIEPEVEPVARLDRRWNPVLIASFAALYFLSVRLSQGRYGTAYVSSPFWLPDSILLCALLLTRRTRWWIFAVTVIATRGGAGSAPGTPSWFFCGLRGLCVHRRGCRRSRFVPISARASACASPASRLPAA